jgi:hypothetical protein
MMKQKIVRLHWVLSEQFGINLLHFFNALRGIPIYIFEYFKFRRNYKGRIDLMPCLHDRYAEGGSAKSEYFWQDLLVAKNVYKNNPTKHIDIGSRVDGFVAHIASFREIEVFDIRKISIKIPGVVFKTANFMNSDNMPPNGYCDSLSCLHALEHFGLGRYNDPIDVVGYENGIKNMAKLLSQNGTFYLSVPIGIERVEFNANRVFNPINIIETALKCKLILNRLIVIESNGKYYDAQLNSAAALTRLSDMSYNLGIFIFKKQ